MIRFLTPVTLAFVMVSVKAHHAAGAFFGGPLVLIEGRLNGAKIVNPHSYLRVTMDDGTDWLIETAASGTAMRQRGFTEELFANGQRVAVSGDSNKDGRKHARLRTVVFLGTNDRADAEFYFLSRMPEAGWVNDIRRIGGPCDSGIQGCFRLSPEQRAQIDLEYGDEPMIW